MSATNSEHLMRAPSGELGRIPAINVEKAKVAGFTDLSANGIVSRDGNITNTNKGTVNLFYVDCVPHDSRKFVPKHYTVGIEEVPPGFTTVGGVLLWNPSPETEYVIGPDVRLIKDKCTVVGAEKVVLDMSKDQKFKPDEPYTQQKPTVLVDTTPWYVTAGEVAIAVPFAIVEATPLWFIFGLMVLYVVWKKKWV
jgi:hypothetical protein